VPRGLVCLLSALHDRRATIDDILQAARVCRVARVMRPYLWAPSLPTARKVSSKFTKRGVLELGLVRDLLSFGLNICAVPPKGVWMNATTFPFPAPSPTTESGPADVTEPTFWRKSGWTARVIKNEDDDGWAVEMKRIGDSEPALVGPWTMGRDKKNPKPLNPKDFATLVKTAQEVLDRAQQHARAMRHKSVTLHLSDGRVLRVDLDIAADEDDPHAIASCFDVATGDELRRRRVELPFVLTTKTAMTLFPTG
jgi:hypothetical protein